VVQELLKRIPKVDRLLEWPEMDPLLRRHPRSELLAAVRVSLRQIRDRIRERLLEDLPGRERIVSLVDEELRRRHGRGVRRVVNATGVVLHTNLGRSPLADAAAEAIRDVSRGYSNLEYDLESGGRGGRASTVEELIRELTGAESCLVVNNNAAAVMLALSALATGREVIISRGELVEIGGSFRIPDVMRQSGALLVEVGATNRTHVPDVRAAISPATALLLKVHTSNFAMVGFTAQVSLGEMAALGRDSGIPVMYDAGSGCLMDLTPHGIDAGPTIGQALSQGADLVTFSGDKLLGGPQAGIIVGRRELLEPMRGHPLLRAVRPDKLSLAALEATLRLYRDDRQALRELPTLRMLTFTPAELSRRGALIIRRLKRLLPEGVRLDKRHGWSSAGGGAAPLLRLPTTLIQVGVAGVSPQRLEASLRRAATPVIGRIHQERLLLDVRTILDRDIPALAASLLEAASALTRKEQ
jgi:L-seryl-tRNA(Ser) seleniumtransferase